MSMVIKLLTWCFVSLSLFLVIEWIRNRIAHEGQVDRRSKRFLAYYYSARISVSVEVFAIATLFLIVLTTALATRVLGHWILGLLTGLIVFGIIVQAVWIRSVEQNQKLDMELPYFIGLIRNAFLATNGNERFALQYAATHVTMAALRNPFLVLMKRWEQGAELQEEAERTKRFYRNPMVWHLLDSVVQEHYGGGSFIQDLERLAEQARDRFRLAEMRKVATAGSVYALYGVIVLNLLLLLVIAAADPAGIRLFRDIGIGKLITGLSMVGYSGILFLAFRLIRLGDE